MLTERRGSLFFISSPNGHNYAYEMFEKCKKRSSWHCVQLTWENSPHISKQEVEDARAEMLESEFLQEYMAEFTSPTNALFKADWLKDILIQPEDWPKSDTIQVAAIGVDQSAGRLKSDLQAATYVGYRDGIFFVDAWAGRVSTPELCRTVRELCDLHKPQATVWEINGLGALTHDEFLKQYREAGLPHPPTIPINNQTDKHIRIARLGGYLSRREIKILDSPGGRLLHSQLCDWPVGKHSFDLPDALELTLQGLNMA